MKIGDRYYFDFNATSPIAASVRHWLSSTEYPEGNPSSVHMTGKRSQWELEQVREFLHTTFALPAREYHLVFHSGASEGIVTLLRGFEEGRPADIFYFTTDHSCVIDTAERMGGHPIPVDKDGDFDEGELVKRIQSCSSPVLLNATWVNNETGVVTTLDKIQRIRKETGCRVHVDAVQAVGKISSWGQPPPTLDAYTFSGHKFGALKGCGFSFVAKTFPLAPLIPPTSGRPLRGGTENLLGIISLKMALEELQRDYSFEKQAQAKNLLEQKISELIGAAGEVVARTGLRNGNTIQLILHSAPAQVTLPALSMGGIDVSSGSACSSGAPTPSHVLLGMGYSKQQAKNALRFSFSPHFRDSEVDEYFQKIQSILVRFVR